MRMFFRLREISLLGRPLCSWTLALLDASGVQVWKLKYQVLRFCREVFSLNSIARSHAFILVCCPKQRSKSGFITFWKYSRDLFSSSFLYHGSFTLCPSRAWKTHADSGAGAKPPSSEMHRCYTAWNVLVCVRRIIYIITGGYKDGFAEATVHLYRK